MSARTAYMDRDELDALLTLLATPGISAMTALRLFREYGSGVAALRSLGHLAEAAASQRVRERVSRALESIERQDIVVIAYDDARYPERLRERLDTHAPLMLFALGDVSLLERTGIAVVGTRKPTQYGIDMAEQIGGSLARYGLVVVSGLAVGIDAAAHNAALESDGATIAINGCGVDVYYPHENMRLQDRIAAHGLLVSEFLPGEPPRRQHFPHRNRIISALSSGVVVVEAAERSGAVATANHAATQGLDVYGVPNLLDAEMFQGVRGLIRDGAATYVGIDEMLSHMNLLALSSEPIAAPEPAAGPPIAPRFAGVWNAIGREATHIDTIAVNAALPTTNVLALLLELELDGRVRQLAGQRFLKVKPAKLSAH